MAHRDMMLGGSGDRISKIGQRRAKSETDVIAAKPGLNFDTQGSPVGRQGRQHERDYRAAVRHGRCTPSSSQLSSTARRAVRCPNWFTQPRRTTYEGTGAITTGTQAFREWGCWLGRTRVVVGSATGAVIAGSLPLAVRSRIGTDCCSRCPSCLHAHSAPSVRGVVTGGGPSHGGRPANVLEESSSAQANGG